MATRIVRIITRLNIGGPSIQATSLSYRLRPHGYETVLVHGRLGPGEGDMSDLIPPDANAVREPSLQRAVAPLADARAVRRIYRLLCRERPALVHTHMAKAGAVGRTAAWLYNRTAGRQRPARLVHTYHGHVLEGYFSPRKTAVFVAAERRLARITDRIVAISPEIRADLLEVYRIGRADQYVVIPLGFDLETFTRVDAAARREARAALQIPPSARVVSTVGRLTAIKQHELLLAAAARLVATVPDALFLIAGDGERRTELEALTRSLGIAANVRFLGWRRDLTTVYGATDVFALTSRNEGTPVALIEAMASGVPGVSTNVGGVSHVIESDLVGATVPDGDPAAFADALRALVTSADLAGMGERARQLVLARFGVERLVTDIVALYGTLTGPAI